MKNVDENPRKSRTLKRPDGATALFLLVLVGAALFGNPAILVLFGVFFGFCMIFACRDAVCFGFKQGVKYVRRWAKAREKAKVTQKEEEKGREKEMAAVLQRQREQFNLGENIKKDNLPPMFRKANSRVFMEMKNREAFAHPNQAAFRFSVKIGLVEDTIKPIPWQLKNAIIPKLIWEYRKLVGDLQWRFDLFGERMPSDVYQTLVDMALSPLSQDEIDPFNKFLFDFHGNGKKT